MNIIQKGAFLAGISVVFGAFGAHGIKNKVTEDLFTIYQTASYYFFIHAVAIILYGLFCLLSKREEKVWPANLFILGILLFSGSLYLMVLTNIRALGMITPLGGLSFIIAWIGFGLHAKRT